MCELLGISADSAVRPSRYFAAFRRRGKALPDGRGNPDGWGIALYPDGSSAQVIKEAIPAGISGLSKFLSAYDHLSSKIFIAHIRKASRGGVTYSNSHPFSRVLRGREILMAHNGTIRKFPRSSPRRYSPVGGTDSERLFCLILDFLAAKRTIEWNDDDLSEIWKFLLGINRLTGKDLERPNKVNVLLSDGETLIAYTDLYGRGTLHRLLLREEEKVPSDESYNSKSHQFRDGNAKSVAVIATKPLLRREGWVPMEPGELCALRDGVVVFSSAKGSDLQR